MCAEYPRDIMTSRTLVLAGAAGVVLLTIASVVLIRGATDPAPAREALSAASPAKTPSQSTEDLTVAQSAARAAAEAEARANAAAAPKPGEKPVVAAAPAPSADPAASVGKRFLPVKARENPPPVAKSPKPKAADPWAAVPVEPGSPSLTQNVASLLKDSLPKISDEPSCNDPEIQARLRAPRPISRRPGQDADPRRPTLLLDLEVIAPNQAIVVDAPLEKQAGASAALVLCTQAALRGATLTVPGGQPGTRLRIRYPF